MSNFRHSHDEKFRHATGHGVFITRTGGSVEFSRTTQRTSQKTHIFIHAPWEPEISPVCPPPPPQQLWPVRASDTTANTVLYTGQSRLHKCDNYATALPTLLWRNSRYNEVEVSVQEEYAMSISRGTNRSCTSSTARRSGVGYCKECVTQ
jgi:hypothetical protein